MKNHYKKQNSEITDAVLSFLKVNELPRIPKYSNWEDYIADPKIVVPTLTSFGFEINKGGRPNIHIEQYAPTYNFSQNK